MTIKLQNLLIGSLLLSLVPLPTSSFTNLNVAPFCIGDNGTRSWIPVQNDSKVKRIVDSIIDLMLKEGKVTEGLDRYFLFESLSPNRERVIDPTSLHYLKEFSAVSKKTAARLLSKGWNYEYQNVVLALGTRPLAEFDLAVEESGSEIDSALKKILSRRGLSLDDFHSLADESDLGDQKKLDEDLSTLEGINQEVYQFIAKRRNLAILERNLVEIKRTFSVKEMQFDGCTFYGVRIKPKFGLILMESDNSLKVVSFGDVL